MKIIQEGEGKKHTCTGKGNGGHGCRAILAVTKEDIYYTVQAVPQESPDYFLTFQCPQCGIETDIEECLRKPEGYPAKAEWITLNNNKNKKGEDV
jgi:hypothetical protein